MSGRPGGRRRRRLGIALVLFALTLAVAMTNVGTVVALFDRQAQIFGTSAGRPKAAAVLFSGDMGLRLGIGHKLAATLAARGIPVLGVSSPMLFSQHRSRADVDRIVAGAIRSAMAKTGAPRIVLMGQSFGADIVAVAAPDLPPSLRDRVAAITLLVPAQTAFFRADPTELAYRGPPDARPSAAMRALDWAPAICIYGIRERDSLCPGLAGSTAQVIALPGGHFLERNDARAIRTVVAALSAVGVV